MKYLFIVAFGLVAACEGAIVSQDTQRIATEEDLQQVIGKRLTIDGEDDNYVYIHADGTLTGLWLDTALQGEWVMRDGYWCRTISEGPRAPQPEDCQLFELTGDQLHVTRNKGEGNSYTYTVN